MPTSVTSVVSHFPEAQNGFTTTTASAVSSGATTVSLSSVAGYTNGQPAVFVIDPTDNTKKQTFTGIIDTAGTQVTNVVWTAGTNQSHALGATVVDYATATHVNMVSKGLQVAHNQDGTLKNNAVTTSSIAANAVTTAKINNGAVTNAKLDTNLGAGWIDSGSTVSSVTANGNRSYTVVTGTDLSASVSPGMRVRTTRTVAAPTQSASLNGTNQYFNKTSPAGMTFTDDFTVMGWVKLNAYPSSTFTCIVARTNAAGTLGWQLRVETTGQVALQGLASGVNELATTYQSLPLNKWVHVAATLDMSGNASTIYFDGISVPLSYATPGAGTALTQSGDFTIGFANTSSYLNGKVAQVAVFSAILSQATIRGYISQGLAGNETSLISAYSLSNSVNDLNTSNANNLTAQNSATTTNADSPFGTNGTLDYGIVQAISGTSITVQVPEGDTIPTSGGVSALAYSFQKTPYGFPNQRSKWQFELLLRARPILFGSGTTNNTWQSGPTNGSLALTIPVGDWVVSYDVFQYADLGATVNIDIATSLSTSNSSESDDSWTSHYKAGVGSGSTFAAKTQTKSGSLSLSSSTVYYLVAKAQSSNGTISNHGLNQTGTLPSKVTVEASYL